eukprot:jgi/Ulvmu1/7339/UM035_0128.1
MTKYDGDPIGIRAGRRGKFVMGKDRKKSMEEFLKTGKHPLLEHTREENAKSILPAMPTVDVNRPHIFMDLKQRSGVRGRIVVELFEDLYPSLCVPFRNRCLEGHHSIKNTHIDKVQINFAAFGGTCPHTRAESIGAPQNHRLQHVDPGLLSVSKDGSHFALTLRRALPLDDHYKIIGRVSKGMDVLDVLNNVDVDPEEKPDTPICIEQCGMTNHKGENEEVSAAGNALGADLSKGARDVLNTASMKVQDALKDGLKRTTAPPVIKPTKRRHVEEAASTDESSDSDDDF